MTYKPPDCKNVYIKKGRVTSHKRWDRPKQHLFNQWLTHIKRYLEMKTHENAEDETKKVDFCWDLNYIQMNDIHSEVYNAGSPFQAFRAGYREGVKMSLDEGRKVPVEDFQKNGKIRSNVLYTFDKIYQNGEIIQDFNTQPNTSVIQLGDNLFLVNKLSPSEKHISRIKDGIEYKKPQKIL